MQSLQFSHVHFEQLRTAGAVTLIHGGAGPVAKAMELSEEATKTGHMVLEQLRSSAQTGARGLICRYPQIEMSQELTLAEAQTIAAVQELESSPAFNSGRGSALQEDGVARVTAAMMESRRRRLSAIVNAEYICNPSLLAVYLQSQRHSVRDGKAANVLLRQFGIAPEDPVTEYQFEVWRRKREQKISGFKPEVGQTGTVGAVSCDVDGFLSAVTSTGGTGFEPVGRIGDVPTVAGTYCTSRTAVSCTGYGEEIVSHALAARIAIRLEDSSNAAAVLERTLHEAKDRSLEMAFICVHKTDQGILWARGSSTAHFAWGVVDGVKLIFKNE